MKDTADIINGEKIKSSFFWKIMENGGSQGIQFIVSIILARLLSPAEYDVLAIMLIFTGIANVLVQNGFATALIQKKNADGLDFSSVFYFNLFLSIFAYMAIYLLAPYIAGFYSNPDIKPMLRIIGVIIFFGSVISVQNAYISKKLEFKALFISTFISAVISGAVSIYLAYKNYGVWALVWQQISYYIILCALLFINISWKPEKKFDVLRLSSMFKFGWKILAASLIDNIFTNMHGLAIGRVYDRGTLGNFNRGEQFPKIVVLNLSAALQSVLLPVMSHSQEDKEHIKELLKSSVMLGTYIFMPMMAGMAASADNIVLFLLGRQWTGSIQFLRLMCAAYVFWPVHIANLQAINALGRSDIFLRLEIIKKAAGIIVLIIGLRYNAVIFVAFKVLADFISMFINAAPNKKIFDYGIKNQCLDLLPNIITALIMGAAVYAAGRAADCLPALKLLVQLLVGITVYGALSAVSKNKSFYRLLRLIK